MNCFKDVDLDEVQEMDNFELLAVTCLMAPDGQLRATGDDRQRYTVFVDGYEGGVKWGPGSTGIQSKARVVTAIDMWRAKVGVIDAVETFRNSPLLTDFVAKEVPDVLQKIVSLREGSTAVQVIRYKGFKHEGGLHDYMNVELFAKVMGDLWWTLYHETDTTGMILVYMQVANKLMLLLRDCLPNALKTRITCSTVDSAKGLEANRVRIVFVPRHTETRPTDIGGLQKDPHRFFQASLRPRDSLIYYIPDAELEAHRAKRTLSGQSKQLLGADLFWERFTWECLTNCRTQNMGKPRALRGNLAHAREKLQRNNRDVNESPSYQRTKTLSHDRLEIPRRNS